MLKGVISERLNKHPSLVGYDLLDNGSKNTGLKGYGLLFKGSTADNNRPKASVFLQNLDKHFDVVLEENLVAKEKLEELDKQSNDKVLVSLNGKIIKEIVRRNGQEYAMTDSNDYTEEQQQIINRLFTMYSQGAMRKRTLHAQVTKAMRVGALDVERKGNERILIRHTKDVQPSTGKAHLVVDPDQTVDPQQIKASLFYTLGLHKQTPEFKKHINLEVLEVTDSPVKYKAVVTNDVITFEKVGAAPTQFELDVCADLRKLKW